MPFNKKSNLNLNQNLNPDPLIFFSLGTFIMSVMMIFLSFVANMVNAYHSNYVGNQYLPAHWFGLFLILVLMHCGTMLQFKSKSYFVLVSRELIYFFLVMSMIGLACNAIQYTPFKPIDRHIVLFEAHLHLNLENILMAMQNWPYIKAILGFCYDLLPYEMVFVPLLLIATGNFLIIREYYFLLLSSALLGFMFYYIYPTTGPASVLDTHLFSSFQQATGLKFQQIHQHIRPQTLEGGLIAMPSFHVIWAWICIYALRIWPVALIFCVPVTVLITLSCVLLGWHYPSDLIASAIILGLCHLSIKTHNSSTPLFKATEPGFS